MRFVHWKFNISANKIIIQSDDKSKEGDVRDVLIIRRGIEWAII